MKHIKDTTCTLLYIILLISCLSAQTIDSIPEYSDEEKTELIAEHVFGALPGEEHILIRRAYILSYDEERRIPNWTAYRVTDEYGKTPAREWEFAKFISDPTMEHPVSNSDYSSSGYDKGHLAPYYICGGDRDKDGHFAQRDINDDGEFDAGELDINNDGKLTSADKENNEYFYIDDFFDLKTVQEINYLSNIAPQHKNFNRNSGLWYDSEVLERQILASDKIDEIWVFAGCIDVGSEYVKGDIFIPEAFFKIIIFDNKPGVSGFIAFLFPHFRDKDLSREIRDYLVSIDIIEEWSGLDFALFPESDEINTHIEKHDSRENWIIVNELF